MLLVALVAAAEWFAWTVAGIWGGSVILVVGFVLWCRYERQKDRQ